MATVTTGTGFCRAFRRSPSSISGCTPRTLATTASEDAPPRPPPLSAAAHCATPKHYNFGYYYLHDVNHPLRVSTAIVALSAAHCDARLHPDRLPLFIVLMHAQRVLLALSVSLRVDNTDRAAVPLAVRLSVIIRGRICLSHRLLLPARRRVPVYAASLPGRALWQCERAVRRGVQRRLRGRLFLPARLPQRNGSALCAGHLLPARYGRAAALPPWHLWDVGRRDARDLQRRVQRGLLLPARQHARGRGRVSGGRLLPACVGSAAAVPRRQVWERAAAKQQRVQRDMPALLLLPRGYVRAFRVPGRWRRRAE